MLYLFLSILFLDNASGKPNLWSDFDVTGLTDMTYKTYDNPGYSTAYKYHPDTTDGNKKEDPKTSASWFELLRALTADWPKNILKWTVGSGGKTFEIDIKDPLSKYPLGRFDMRTKDIEKLFLIEVLVL